MPETDAAKVASAARSIRERDSRGGHTDQHETQTEPEEIIKAERPDEETDEGESVQEEGHWAHESEQKGRRYGER